MLLASNSQKIKYFIAAFILLSGLMAMANASADVYVICNSNLGATDADIKDLFTGEKQAIGGTKVVPVDNKSAQGEFLAKVVALTKVKYDSNWAKKSFRDGLTAPSVLGGDADVTAHVKANPGGCGYVASAPSDGVKLVKKY